jgi:hypothetical protein
MTEEAVAAAEVAVATIPVAGAVTAAVVIRSAEEFLARTKSMRSTGGRDNGVCRSREEACEGRKLKLKKEG